MWIALKANLEPEMTGGALYGLWSRAVVAVAQKAGGSRFPRLSDLVSAQLAARHPHQPPVAV